MLKFETGRERLIAAAFLYEGEGCISSTLTKGHSSVGLAVQMTDLEPLEMLKEIFACGNITGPRQPKGKASYKKQWRWKVSNWPEVIEIALKLRPWLSPRRVCQIDAVLAQQPTRQIGPMKRYPSNCPLIAEPTQIYYRRHLQRGETPCTVCKASQNLYRRLRYLRQHAA